MLQLSNMRMKSIKVKTKNKVSPVKVWNNIVKKKLITQDIKIGNLDVDITEKYDNCLWSLVEIDSENVTIEVCSNMNEESVNVTFY